MGFSRGKWCGQALTSEITFRSFALQAAEAALLFVLAWEYGGALNVSGLEEYHHLSSTSVCLFHMLVLSPAEGEQPMGHYSLDSKIIKKSV